MRISFLLNNGFGVGGTVAAVFTLAGALAKVDDVEVEVVSVFRRVAQPTLRVPPGVRLGYLLDMRVRGTSHASLLSGPSDLVPAEEEYFRQYSRDTDAALAAYARRTDIDVVVATRPGLAIAVSLAGCRPRLVMQMHHVAANVPSSVDDALTLAAREAHAVHAVSRAEADLWRRRLAPSVSVSHVPNPIRQSPLPPANDEGAVLLAVGRLDPVKRHDLLIRAFSEVADEYRDWTLRILGDGPERTRLQMLIDMLGQAGRIELAGRTPHVFEHMAGASILGSTSVFESFGLTLVEGMSAGLAVVSSDCPIGPRELVQDGENGLLFPSEDSESLRERLGLLMGDRALRGRLAAQGMITAQQFAPDVVADRFLRAIA